MLQHQNTTNSDLIHVNASVPLSAISTTPRYPGMSRRVEPGVVQGKDPSSQGTVARGMRTHRIQRFRVRREDRRSGRRKGISRRIVLRILRNLSHTTQVH